MVSLLLSSLLKAEDNVINLDQSGDDLTLYIEQVGHNNKILLYDSGSKILGNDVSIRLYQYNSSSSAPANTIKLWHIYGSDNYINWGQGAEISSPTDTTFENGADEVGGHYSMIDIHGNNNSIAGFQKNAGSGEHDADIYVWGNDNDVWIRQKGTGDKNLDLLLRNSDNDVSILQRGHGSHSASVDIRGTYPTDLNLTQKGSSTQSYSLIQNCLTLGGCTVSVIQE